MNFSSPDETAQAKARATGGRPSHYLATSEDAGRRLDLFLAARITEISRTRVQELIREGRVRVDDRIAKVSHRVSAGERIEVEVLPRPAPVAQAEDLPIEMLHVDDDFVVVNKPAGMVVHAGAGHSQGTLVNALLHRLGTLSAAGDALRPGIVHRLDRETSGAMVVARNDRAHEKLAEQFRSRNVRKIYLALVHGKMPRDSGSITLPISRDERRRTRMTARAEKGRHARTDWRVLGRLDGATLVEATLHTGRTHQIRAHFAVIGHPVVGDTLYGAPAGLAIRSGTSREGRTQAKPRGLEAGKSARRSEAGVATRNLPLPDRNFLHAARLGFAHPSAGEWVEVAAPLPPELRVYFGQVAEAQGWRSTEIEAVLAPYV